MTDQTSERILHAVMAAFEQNILPVLNTDRARIDGGLIHHALKLLEGRQRALDTAVAQRDTRRASLRSEISVILGQDLPEGSGAIPDTAYRPLFDAAAANDARARAARRELAAVVENETRYFVAMDPACLGGGAEGYRGGRRDTGGSGVRADPLTAEALTQWARQHWPMARDAQITDVAPMPGGFSKTTVFFTLKSPAGEQRLVLRRDLPVPLLGQSVVSEYPLLVKLHAAGFAVAEPLFVEPRKEFVDGAFLISRRLSGSVDMMAWKNDRQSVLIIARQLAENLARLHRCDVVEMGFDKSEMQLSAKDCMAREIARWYKLYQAKAREPQPLLELVFAWLMRNIPDDLARRPARLLHGDAGFHNLLVDQGRVTALLDWEFFHLGDPIEDLNYARQFIEQVMDWQEFLQLYTAAGGLAYPQDDRFFSVWSATRNPAGCIDSIALFENVLPEAINLAMAGYLFGPRLQVAAANKVIDIINTGHST